MTFATWTSELELVNVLERGIAERAANKLGKRVRVYREFDACLGRVDLLCVWYNEGRLARRRAAYPASEPKRFGLLEGYAMTYLRGAHWIDKARLQEALRLSARRTVILVDRLHLRGLVECRDNMVRARPMSTLWFIEHIEAYEAKLHNWKHAAEQASRHLWFASRCYVAMPRLSDKVLRQVVDKCQQWYLGLCVFPDQRSYRVEHPPPRRKAPATQLGWLMNERIFEEA